MPLPKGTLTIDILPDGTVRVETGDMGGVAHKSADDFLTDLGRLLGGEVTEEKVKHGHVHSHTHEHGEHHHHQ